MDNYIQRDIHYKKFITAMLKVEGGDFRYIRNLLNLDLFDSEGNSYLHLICKRREQLNTCKNLMRSIKELSDLQLRHSHPNRNEIKYYLNHQNLMLIKVDKEYALMAEISDFETMTYEQVRVRTISDIIDLNKMKDMSSNQGN